VKNIKWVIILMVLFAFPEELNAQENWQIIDEEEKREWYKPDFFTTQYAGNIGFLSLGLGYSWWSENAHSEFIYGYVPESKGNATIHTFTIKNTFALYKFNILNKYNLSPIIGFSLSLEPGENSYMKVPERYPDGYYSANSFYACINVGLKSNFKFKKSRHFSSIDVYAEINTLADYIYYNIIAQEDRSDNIGSYALGVNVFF